MRKIDRKAWLEEKAKLLMRLPEELNDGVHYEAHT